MVKKQIEEVKNQQDIHHVNIVRNRENMEQTALVKIKWYDWIPWRESAGISINQNICCVDFFLENCSRDCEFSSQQEPTSCKNS